MAHLQGNDRTLPSWLDPNNIHGAVTILQMKAEDGILPSNPFIIEKSVVKQVGKISDAYKSKDGSLIMKVRNVNHVEALLQLKTLIDGTKINISKHPILNRTKVVVSCAEVKDMDDATLLRGLQEKYNIIEIRRIKKMEDGHLKNTPAMILTFDGTVAPNEVFIGFQRCRTRVYLPNPMQCFRCFRFGHTKTNCRGKETCRNCSKEHPILLDLNRKQVCSEPAYCRNCEGNHQLASRQCPIYREEEMVIIMRAERGVSIGEARQLVKNNLKKQNDASTYAEAAAKSTELEQLKGEVRNLLQKIAANENELKALSNIKHQQVATNNEITALKKELAKARKTNDDLASINRNLEAELNKCKKSKPSDSASDSDRDMFSSCSDNVSSQQNSSNIKSKTGKPNKNRQQKRLNTNTENKHQPPNKNNGTVQQQYTDWYDHSDKEQQQKCERQSRQRSREVDRQRSKSNASEARSERSRS